MNDSGEEMPIAAKTAKPIELLDEFWSAVAKQMTLIRKTANCDDQTRPCVWRRTPQIISSLIARYLYAITM